MLGNLRQTEFAALSSIYLNAAYFGPLPKRTQEAVQQALKRGADPSFMDYGFVEFPEQTRALLAKLLGCKAENISLNSSTSEVISTIANGIELDVDDHVVLLEDEYPSDVIAWMLLAERGRCKLNFVPREKLNNPDEFVKALAAKTRVVNLSHVSFQTGSICSIEALGKKLHERGILFVADVTQSLGGMPIKPEVFAYIDVMVSSTYKWMLSPYGQAFALWSERALAEIQHTHAGWLTLPHAPYQLTKYTTATKSGARKFDRGQTPNFLGLKGMQASIELLIEVGLDVIYKHNQSLVAYFMEHFPKQDYQLLTEGKGSNIVCVKAKKKSSEALQKDLKDRGIDVSIREGNVRISFHLFNTMSDVNHLIAAL